MTGGHAPLAAAVLAIAGFIAGIRLMRRPQTALWGNRLGALSMLLAIAFTLYRPGRPADPAVLVLVFSGGGLGLLLARRVKIIQLPQLVALLNGLGGGASAVVARLSMAEAGAGASLFFRLAALAAVALGTVTLTGSLVAAGKLQGRLPQRPLPVPGHGIPGGVLLAAGLVFFLLSFPGAAPGITLLRPETAFAAAAAAFGLYGILAAMRVGGADMPIIISLFNSLSGLAAAACGISIANLFLAGTGFLVGAAGLVLTRLMCRAMNRTLPAVLKGFRVPGPTGPPAAAQGGAEKKPGPAAPADRVRALAPGVRRVIIVPGYGMAVAQAQQQVRELVESLEQSGREVRIAIHPVAGRMPGHMNVLLAEAGLPYEKLFDLEAINGEFAQTDLVIAVGACDVINPAADTAPGTPIHGMPILKAAEAKHVIICNLDDRPGYSGVENTLYRAEKTIAFWGSAAATVPLLAGLFREADGGRAPSAPAPEK